MYFSYDEGASWSDTSLAYYGVSPDGIHFNFEYSPFSAWKSHDHGKTWTPFHHPGGALYFGPNGLIVAAHDTILKVSKDRGNSWILRTLPYPLDLNTEIHIDSAGNFYYARNRLLFKSSDDGSSWSQNAMNVYAGQIVATAWGKVFMATGGVMYTIESGFPKIHSMSLVSSNVTAIADDDDGDLWVGMTANNPHNAAVISSDQGLHWDLLPITMSISYFHAHKDRMIGVMAPSYDTIGIYISRDKGQSWVLSREFRSDTSISSITSSGEVLLIGTYKAGIFRSTDGGFTWNGANGGITNGYVTSVITTTDGRSVAATLNGLFVTSDQGLSWLRTEPPSPDLAINSLAVDSSGRLYAGTAKGLYRTDDMTTWTRVYIGLSDWPVVHLVIDSSQNLYAAGRLTNWIHYSSDRGLSWQQLLPLDIPTSTLNRLYASNDGAVYAGTPRGLHRTFSKTGYSEVHSARSSNGELGLVMTTSGFILANASHLSDLLLNLFDQAGRLVFSVSGTPSFVLSELNKLRTRHAWYGYVLRANEEQVQGSILVTPR